jgi:hypothetical protein
MVNKIMQEKKKNCVYCGLEFQPVRRDKKYCSAVCKSRASIKRRDLRLSDASGNKINSSINNSSLLRLPDLQVPTTTSIVSDFASTAVSGAMGQFRVPNISNIVSTLQDPNIELRDKVIVLGSMCAGVIAGYQLAGEGRRFAGILLGGMGGYIVSQLVVSLESRSEVLVGSSLSDESIRGFTTAEIRSKSIPVLNLLSGTALCHLVGGILNDRFSVMVYGEAGGGKSHLGTLFASELSNFGSVLYVLSEEGLTSSVQRRVLRYNCGENVIYFPCSDEVKILERASGFDFLIIDSLNGMCRFNYHTDFLRKAKGMGFRGLVLLNQVGKCGSFIGNNSILHEVDVEIIVSDGVAVVGKNRFGVSGSRFEIFDDKRVI